MKEQFDKELRNHIKDTFGVFDDHLADDGWRKLNDRKKKKRRAFFFWYLLPSGIAASRSEERPCRERVCSTV